MFFTVLVNATNKVGAVGFIPFIGEVFYPVTLIRVDPETNEPIRGRDNLCIKCKPGKKFWLKINLKKNVF